VHEISVRFRGVSGTTLTCPLSSATGRMRSPVPHRTTKPCQSPFSFRPPLAATRGSVRLWWSAACNGGPRAQWPAQLRNFFFISPEKGDLHVGQFVAGQSWKAVTGRKNRWDDLLVRASTQVAHLTAERHFNPRDQQKQQWPVSRLVGEVAEELQVFCDRTGFAGFPGIVPSTGVLVVDMASGGSMSAENFITTATNAPTVCNSVAVNRTVKGNR